MQHVTIITDDFEVSIFLTETTTRHSLLTKHKHFHDTTQTKLTSNSGRLIGETNEAPIDVDAAAELAPTIRQEESDGEDAAATLAAIPVADETAAASSSGRRPKRARRATETEANADPDMIDQQNSGVEIVSDSQDEDDQDDGLFVSDEDPVDHDDASTRPPPAKRRKEATTAAQGSIDEEDDKKKLAMDISYEGFSIYGRVLCLVVKRRDGSIGSGPQPAGRGSKPAAATSGHATKPGGGGSGGQAMMENFIMSTQVPAGADIS